VIDTVVLIIPETNYKILDPKKFTPSANALDLSVGFGAKAYIKCVQNTSDEDYKNGLSRIKLTLTKRSVVGGFRKTLKIEFSATKLLLFNNLNELSENDYPLIIDTLRKRLLEMGIELSGASLNLAQVYAIHYSKNILLPQFTTSSMILKELAKVNITNRLSLDKTFFKNLGHALTFYSKSYAIIIYDKKKDIEQEIGLKIDDDIQQNMFSVNKELPEILRIEIRLNKPYKIEALEKIMGKPKDRTFINLFKQDIAKNIVLYHWELMTTGKNAFLFSDENDLDKIAEEIYKNNPKISAQKFLATIGYLTFSKQKGVRILRQFIESKYTKRTWFRIANYSKALTFYGSLMNKMKFWLDIRNVIMEFKPINLLDFENKMINNDKDS
jgi:hypothetical protein